MGRILWAPSEEQIQNTNMFQFMQLVNRTTGEAFSDYPSLYQWSVENISEFWEIFCRFADIITSEPYSEIADNLDIMPGTKWFPGAKLNFAENLLRYRDEKTAIIFKSEEKKSVRMSYSKLYDEVARTALSLKAAGVHTGDRVAGFMPNLPQTIIAMLASVSIGAVWSSCSPDFGIKGVLDRFGQIQPKILFTADGYFFKGKAIDCLSKISTVIQKIPSIEKLIVIPYISETPDISIISNAIHFDEFKSDQSGLSIEFEQLPADHPLYIMYSSGTTGLPKCMVQSAGGILVQHLKELLLHTNLKRSDTIFFYTTCGWMMWNWLTTSLATGASIVLFDGNPFYPHPGLLWEMAQDEKITVFGTSAGYITALMTSDIRPGKDYNLSNLKSILSTGSPLSIEGFEFVYEEIKSDLQLASISGGTDLNGCFALGNPMGKVYSGELQCRGLGMKVEAFDENGNSIVNQQGELVCTAPFPSMPIHFWDDPDNKKYHKAYFDVYEDTWRHGDFIEINERGGVTIYGRSDTTLNPGGVRIGTAEIYRQVDQFDEIEDSIVIGQTIPNDIRVILFVQPKEGFVVTHDLEERIKTTIRLNASPRHIPAIIISVPEIPYTLNMKKVELAVKNTVERKPVLNKDALKNPDSLNYFENIKELQ